MDDKRRQHRVGRGDRRGSPAPGRPITVVDLRRAADVADAEPGAVSTLGRRRRVAVTITVLGLAAAVAFGVLLSRPGPDRQTAERPPEPTVSSDSTAVEGGIQEARETLVGTAHLAVVTEADVGAVAAGGSRLALVDTTGVTFADGDSASVTASIPSAVSIATPLGSAGAVVQVDEPTGELVEYTATERRVIAPTADGGAAVGADGSTVWLADLDPRGRLVLAAIDRSTGVVGETIELARGEELVGFHRGRPITERRGVVRRHAATSVEEVVRGTVIAQAGRYLLFHSCVAATPCHDPAMLFDLDTGRRVEVGLDTRVRAFGAKGASLSPDGRWLVGLDLFKRSTPAIAVYEIGPADVVGGLADPLLLSAGLLGFGGRSVRFAWSPEGDILAAPGSQEVVLVDPQERTASVLPISLEGERPGLAWVDTGTER